MKFQTAAILIAFAAAPAFASDNKANDYLLSLTPQGQADMLGKAVGDGCQGKRAFNQGMVKTGYAANVGNWSVRCKDGRSYSVGVHPDGTSKVLECSTLKAVAHIDCFKKLDSQ